MKTRFPYLCLFLLLGLLRSGGSVADTYVVGVEDVSYFPYFDFNSKDVCFSETLLTKFGDDSGHKLVFLPLPIKQFGKWLYEQNIDFKFPDNKRWQDGKQEYALDLHFSNDIVYMTAGTIVMPENKDLLEGDFKNVGTIAGFTPTLWMDQINKGTVALIEDTSPTILVKQLVTGIVDGLDLDLAVARHNLKKLDIDTQLMINQQTAMEVYAYQLSTIKHPTVIQEFNQWLTRNQPWIEELKKHYGITQVEPLERLTRSH